MTGWDKYSETKAQGMTGDRPKVSEYFWIRVIDNGLVVTIVILTLLFAAAGFILQYNKVDGSNTCYDLAKLSLGVVLGLVADKRQKK